MTTLTNEEVVKMKGDIADKYLEDFKGELNFLQKLAISPVNKKLKDMMMSSKNAEKIEDIWRWWSILGFMLPALSDKICDFLKEKQQLLVQAETQGDLQTLFYQVKGITPPPPVVATGTETGTESSGTWNEAWPESTGTWTETSEQKEPWSDQTIDPEKKEEWKNNEVLETGVQLAAPWVVWYPTLKAIENSAIKSEVKALTQNAEVKTLQQNFTDLSENLKLQAKNSNLDPAMVKNLNKSAKNFEDIGKGLADGDMKLFEDWSVLKNELPIDKLKNIDPKIWTKLGMLSDDALKQIAATEDTKLIKDILKKNGFTTLEANNIDLLKALQKIKNPLAIKAAGNIIKLQKNVLRVLRGLKWIALLDVIMLGVDIWMRDETMEAAEEEAKVNAVRWDIMKSRANTELIAWIWLAAASIALAILTKFGVVASICATVPGFGWIAAAVIVVVWVIVSLIVSDYYEKKDFYAQNRENFLAQERTDIKQALLQNANSEYLDLHSWMREDIKDEYGLNTVKEALEALIYKEHMFDGQYPALVTWKMSWMPESEYKATLSWEALKEYEDQNTLMQQKIAKRMEYIYPYFTKWTPENVEFIKKLRSSEWLISIENLLAESKVYLDKADQWETQFVLGYENKSITEYKTAYAEKLKGMDQKKFDLFEKMYTDDKIKFYEICSWVITFWAFHKSEKGKSEYIYADSVAVMDTNLEFITRFFEYKNLWVAIERRPSINFTDIDYAYYSRILRDIENIKDVSVRGEQEVKDYFSLWLLNDRAKGMEVVSDSTGQNIIYRIAVEFHGYQGENNALDLMNFFSVNKDDARGLYYSDGWYINIDNANDVWIDLRDIDNNKRMNADNVCQRWFGWNDMLDSPVEWADYVLNQEYKTRVHEIVQDEMSYKEPDNKKTIETEIVEIVKNSATTKNEKTQTEWWYIKLPFSLMIKAKKAGIWDIENYLFKYENGTIVAISIKQKLAEWELLNFDQTKTHITYERIAPLREELTEQEKKVIAKVDKVRKRLEEMRTLQTWRSDNTGGHSDEISLPIEIEHTISAKWIERDNFKENLMYMHPRIAVDTLNENWEWYYSYFEDLYMGMLATISQFTWNDNISHIRHFNTAIAAVWWQIVQYDANGKPKMAPNPSKLWETTIDISHLNAEDEEKEVFLEKIKGKYQGETKTIEQLLLSENEEEKKRGNRLARQLLISIFETETVYFNEDGTMRSIWCNADQDSEIDNRIKANIEGNTYVDTAAIIATIDKDTIPFEEWKISKVWKVEKNTYEAVKQVTQQIIATKEDVDRQWRRLGIEFLLDEKVSNENLVAWNIESYGTTTGIAIETTTSQKESFADEKWGILSEWLITTFINNNKTGGSLLWSGEFTVVKDWKNVYTHNESWIMSMFWFDDIYAKMIPWEIYEINAWWKTMKVQKKIEPYQKLKNGKIAWLNVNFDSISELVQAANFMNRAKWQYLKEHADKRGQFFFGSSSGTLYTEDGLNDTDILSTDALSKWFPKFSQNEGTVVNYINAL